MELISSNKNTMKKLLFLLSISILVGCKKEPVEINSIEKPYLISITIDDQTTETVRVK
jgi:hypothetical protein